MRRSIYGTARETTLSKKEREKVRRVLVKKRGRASAESSIEKRDRSREELSGSMMPGCGLMKFSSRVHLLMQCFCRQCMNLGSCEWLFLGALRSNVKILRVGIVSLLS